MSSIPFFHGGRLGAELFRERDDLLPLFFCEKSDTTRLQLLLLGGLNRLAQNLVAVALQVDDLQYYCTWGGGTVRGTFVREACGNKGKNSICDVHEPLGFFTIGTNWGCNYVFIGETPWYLARVKKSKE